MSGSYFGFNSTQEKTLRDLGIGPDGTVDTGLIENLAVTTAKINTGAVTTAKLAADAVTVDKLADNAVVNANVDAAAAIAATKIAYAVGTSGLAAGNAQVTMQALYLAVANLNAWATALATKLNADAGVTDVNYDTDPQA